MKIGYFDLNFSDHSEDYSVNPKRYGGGRVFAANAKEKFNDSGDGEDETEFFLFSDERSFENINRARFGEKWEHCFVLSQKQKEQLRNGESLSSVVETICDLDLVVHHHTNIWINTDVPQVAWSLGIGEHVHEKHKYVILYNDFQQPRLFNPGTKILKARIGKDIPEFQKREKEDFIFQCTRHTPTFGSTEVARFCLENKIQGIFAGPIDNGYPLLNFIDNKTTHYLGMIPESEKLSLTARARLYTFLHSWPTPFNLSAIEALSLGTPIVATNVGFWTTLITHRCNGFIIENYKDLEKAWELAPNIKQKTCYDSAAQFSTENMLKDFYKAFQIVLQHA